MFWHSRESTDGEKILKEAELRFINLVKCNFSAIIKELDNLDIHQYLRAYTFGWYIGEIYTYTIKI